MEIELDKATKHQINLKWPEVQQFIRQRFQHKRVPDLNAILMLIGINELGQVKNKYSKEEKEGLMHIAICHMLSKEGYYTFNGLDADGWPHWEGAKPMPKLNLSEQEYWLKQHVIRYFEL